MGRLKQYEVDRGRRQFLVSGLTATGGFLLGVPALELLAQEHSAAAGLFFLSCLR